MRTVLIIQGRRGHISQAISYCQNNPQIKIVSIIISTQKEIPEEFFEEFKDIPITKLKSLNFAYSKGKVNPFKTFFINLWKMPIFIRNIFKVKKILLDVNPELVLNFYEPLSIGTLLTNIKKISIANQYLFFHKGWKYPIRNNNTLSMKFWNIFTSIGSDQIIAPSFINFPNTSKVKIIDPLIRKEIKSKIGTKGNYILIYLIDKFILGKVLNNLNKEENYVLFCDPDFIKERDLPNNVQWRKINKDDFVEKLVNCKSVISTGGFQLICESLYLNKKIEVLPLHYEQEISIYNLEFHNLGKKFNLD